MLNKLLIITATILLSVSCEKDSGDRVILSDNLYLRATYEDGKVILSWNKVYAINFRYYAIERSTATLNSGGWFNPIQSLYDFNTTTFVDSTFPLSEKLYYRVYLFGDNSFMSNTIEINTGFKLNDIKVDDAVLFEPAKKVFLVNKMGGKIYKYDYVFDRIIDSLSLNYKIEFIDAGNNGKGDELYVTGDGGNLHIYDIKELKHIDEINVGLTISSVVSTDNGYLAVSVEPSPWWEEPLRSYSRATKEKVSGGGDFDFTRLRYAHESNELIEISRTTTPTDVDYYRISQAGSITQHLNDPYHGDYPLDYNIFQLTNSGDFFVTSSYGAVYDRGMNYLKQFGNYGRYYNDFCFSEDNQYVYAANFENKIVEKFKLEGNSTDVISYQNTKAFPLFLFNLGDSLLSIGSNESFNRSSYYSDAYSGIFIEKLDHFKKLVEHGII